MAQVVELVGEEKPGCSSPKKHKISMDKEFMSNHALVILNKLNEDRKSEKIFCDVTVRSGGQEFHAHKCVLGAFSVFYEKLFTCEMKEKLSNTAEINTSAETLDKILDFIYTGKITLNMENVYSVLEGSEYMQLPHLKQQCGFFLFQNISLDNCVRVHVTSKLYGLTEVLQKTKRVIFKDLESVLEQEEFLALGLDVLTNLLQFKERQLSSEEIAYKAVVGWVKHDVANRKKFYFTLFQLIDLTNLSREFLGDEVFAEKLFMDSHECKDFLFQAMLAHVPEEIPDQVLTDFFVMGGENNDGSVIKYNTVYQEWSDMPSLNLNTQRYGATAFTHDETLYLVGGSSNSIDSINLKQPAGGWINGGSIAYGSNTSTMFAATALLSGCIYVSGGGVNGQYTNICTKYNIENENSSANVGTMNEIRCKHGMVSLNGFLFAVGGIGHNSNIVSSQQQPLTSGFQFQRSSLFGNSRSLDTTTVSISHPYLESVERYSPNSNIWEQCSRMNVARSGLATVVLNGQIYAIGGRNDFHWHSSVERYDPLNDEWVEIASLVHAREGACACVVNGKIYVVGGRNGGGDVLSVEVYDPLLNKWKVETLLKSRRVWSAIVCG